MEKPQGRKKDLTENHTKFNPYCYITVKNIKLKPVTFNGRTHELMQ